MKGYNCDNCECHLDDSDFVSHLSWSYTCHTCGFTYRHGASTAQEQVNKYNDLIDQIWSDLVSGEEDDS